MMPRWLYLWPLHFVEIGYIIFGAIFLLARERSHGKTKKADRVSIVAIFIQALAFAIAWTIARKHFTPFLPMVDWRAQYLVATLIVGTRDRLPHLRDGGGANAGPAMEFAGARARTP